MGLAPRGSPPTPEGARFFDVMDPPVYGTNLTNGTFYFRRGGYIGSSGGFGNPPVREGISGWAATAPLQGGPWGQATSASATRKTWSTSRFQMPIGFDLASAPERSRVPLRFQHEAVIWRVTPLAAAAPLTFMCGWTGGIAQELSDATTAGYECVSRSDLNGGRWTIRTRKVSGAALTVVQDTGIDPATTPQIHLALRYDLALAPRLSFILNSTEYGALAGLTEIPTGDGSLLVFGLCQGLIAAGGVGQVDRSRAGRFYIEELGT